MAESKLDLGRVLQLAAEHVPAADRARLESFGRAFLRGAERGDPSSERLVSLRVADAFAFAEWRAPGEIRAAVASPDDRPGRSVLQLLQDDRPFIVATVRLLLRRQGLRARVFLHPVLAVRRDEAGRLVDVDAPDAPRESQIYVELTPRIDSEERREEVRSQLLAMMAQVR